MASLTPTNTCLPSSWASENNNTSFREASFSSYLSNSEETYIRSLVESTQNQLHSKHQNQYDSVYTSQPQKKVEGGEIDVFSADKYFNSRIEEHNNVTTRSKSSKYPALELDEERTNHEMVKSNKLLKVQSRTLSSSQSEFSSNSQSALLKRFHKTPSRISNVEGNKNNVKGQAQGILSLFSCSCCVKKSVDIDKEFISYKGGVNRESISEGYTGLGYSKGVPRTIKTSLDTSDMTRLNKLRLLDNSKPFVFPVITDSPGFTKANKLAFEVQEDETKKSLDVFGSSDLDEGSRRFSLQKSLKMLSWDGIPRTITTEEINTSEAPSETYKDTESDASSDLFEIECLTYSANPVNVQGPRILPSDVNITPATGYAPSEASIEWSVVTASAADFSFASDSEDQRSGIPPSLARTRIGSKSNSSAKRLSMNKEVQKPVSNILLGCKSQKAVNVAQEVLRKSPARRKLENQKMQKVSDSFAPVTRFQAEANLAGFGYGQRQSLSPDLLYNKF